MSGTQQNNKLTPAQVASVILNGASVGGVYQAPAVVVRQPIGSPKVLTNPSISVPNTIVINPLSVGLVRKFYLLCQVTFTVPAGTVLTRAPFGEANIMSSIGFIDLNNLTRHQTSGKHLIMVNSAKQRWASGAAAVTDTPFGFGSNFGGGANVAPQTITGTGQSVTMSVMYELPIMYQDNDFRGAMYLGTTQAQSSINLTLNQTMFAASTADPSDAVYMMNAGGVVPTITNVTVLPTQEYFDQLPSGSDGLPLLPLASMQQIYQLINTTQTGIVANTDATIPLANLRTYLSAIVEYDNGGTLYPGTDINYWALKAANMYNFSQLDPLTLDYITRRDLSMSMPNGSYYFNWRNAPLNTTQFGNTNLVINAKSAATNAVAKIGWEFFSTTTTLAGGASMMSA